MDRDDVGSKIRNKYYDFIVCPIHHTEVHNHNSTGTTISSLHGYYPKNKIAIIDGWDRQPISEKLSSLGVYFKRELSDQYKSIAKPISFSLPKEKIQPLNTKERSFDFAPLVPAYGHFEDPHMESYKYESEEDYYNMYSDSYFSYTCKKGREDVVDESWDCMRHYEILAAGSIPYFTDIEKCPENTMKFFPKILCKCAKKIEGVHPGTKEKFDSRQDTFIGTSRAIKPGEERGHIDRQNFDFDLYQDMLSGFRRYTEKYLTTESMAKYLLEEMNKCSE